MKKKFLHGITVMGARGQIVIPQSIRTALKLKTGAELIVLSRGEKIVVFPSTKLETFYKTFMENMDDLRKQLKK